MSRPLPNRSYLTLLAVVSALLILKLRARRTPKKPLLLKDLKNVDAGDVAGPLFDSEYDIIIAGGGEPPLFRCALALG